MKKKEKCEKNNYKKGMEWVYKYYTEGCKESRWRYKGEKVLRIKEIEKELEVEEYVEYGIEEYKKYVMVKRIEYRIAKEFPK